MNILIISQNTWPLQNPRAFRTAELSEYLSKLGHKVVLYTVHGRYDYTSYEKETGIIMKNIRTIFSIPANDGSQRNSIIDRGLWHYFHRLLAFPECEFRYRIPKIIRQNPNFDLLITIAYPHTIHSGAARAKLLYSDIFPKVWIADCGDPFFLNPFANVPAYMERYEREWCDLVDYITIPLEQGKSGYFTEYWDKIIVIPQAFDFSKTPICDYKKNEVPTFIFTGTIYPGKRDIHSFMKFLIDNIHTPYKFKLYVKQRLDDTYSKASNGQIEFIYDKTRTEIIYECSKADFLINVTNIGTVQSPSKLIDYAIANRPILDISSDFQEEIIFKEFLSGNYSNAHVVTNIDSFRIENVARQFLELV